MLAENQQPTMHPFGVPVMQQPPEESSEGEEGNDSVLLQLVQQYDWPGALGRIASHPSEAASIGQEGRKPLHVACDHDAPAVVIAALLKAYPDATLRVGTSQMNPLHITCSSPHASVHVVRVLLEGGLPQQLAQCDVDGDTPLHAACRCGAPLDVLEVLLRAHPVAVHTRDFEGLTPLLRLWVRYFCILGPDIMEGVRGPADLLSDHGGASMELSEAWYKTELLLRYCATTPQEHQQEGSLSRSPSTASLTAAVANIGGLSNLATASAASVSNNHSPPGSVHGGPPSQLRNGVFRVLHAAAKVDCPRQVVKMAAQVFSEQLQQRDEQGFTPLASAARAPIYAVRDLTSEGYTLEDVIHGDDPYGNADETHGHDPEIGEGGHNGSQQPSVIEILLQSNLEGASSAACVPDNAGRLPLHWALVTGKRWQSDGVQPLVEAFPDAVGVADPHTRLYPFVLAGGKFEHDSFDANDEQQRRDGDLTTSFELLRLNPNLLEELRPKTSST